MLRISAAHAVIERGLIRSPARADVDVGGVNLGVAAPGLIFATSSVIGRHGARPLDLVRLHAPIELLVDDRLCGRS